jgi:hypothetical protein
MIAAGNGNQEDFARVLTLGLRETEAVLANLVGMDRLHEFDLGTLRAILDQALEWNHYAQHLMGEMCARGGYNSLAEMWFMLAGISRSHPALLKVEETL